MPLDRKPATSTKPANHSATVRRSRRTTTGAIKAVNGNRYRSHAIPGLSRKAAHGVYTGLPHVHVDVRVTTWARLALTCVKRQFSTFVIASVEASARRNV